MQRFYYEIHLSYLLVFFLFAASIILLARGSTCECGAELRAFKVAGLNHGLEYTYRAHFNMRGYVDLLRWSGKS